MLKKKDVLALQKDASQLDFMNDLHNVSYTEEQKDFIDYNGNKSVILSAVAGSGKTFSSVQRLKSLLRSGVLPEKIIFFSYTKAATEELISRIGRDDVKITTIHAFAASILTKIGKFKKIASFYDFIEWYKEKNKPSQFETREKKNEFYEIISNLYDESEYLSSSISSFKLQNADNIKCLVPPYLSEYSDFLKETRSRDFSDMLIEVRDLLKEEKWLRMFRGQYEYIFIDEYQDTSTIQLQILLALNAKYYYLIGDRAQSIFGFSGTNCKKIEYMLKNRRDTIEKTLSVNFRSDEKIVTNSNRFSSLKATPKSTNEGFVKRYIIFQIKSQKEGQKTSLDLISVLDSYNEVAVLVRTNAVIKKIEFELLKLRYPMKYFNYITNADLIELKKGNINLSLKDKIEKIRPFFNNSEAEIISFIENNKNSKKIVTSIHKSKGREFDYCVVVNSIDMELIESVGLQKVLSPKQLTKITFDEKDFDNEEPKNIHYVAISRAKHGMFYMIYDF